MSTAATPLPIERLWPRQQGLAEGLRQLVLIAVGSLLLWASAKIQVPFWPVPMTLQTGMLFLIGVAYGSRLGLLTALAYLAEGALGLPVFAGTPERGIGIAYMLGPTGGYLAAFPVMAWMAGVAAERGVRWLGMALTLLIATAVNYTLGVSWLSTFVGASKALELGLLPFVLGDLVKLALVVAAWELGLGRSRAGGG
jgi:biotin transport system substrate-specific component